MNILITGGMGFVGYHLSKYLSNEGNKISIYDNFSNSQKNISDPNIEIIQGDILDKILLSKSINTGYCNPFSGTNQRN
jgi:UDP-glucose 4-epimerase